MKSFNNYIIFKPYGMLSQFSKDGDKPTLGDLFTFPEDVYPVGRLDSDSEGLLILTNDNSLNFRLLDPQKKHRRTYLVQVEGIISDKALQILSKGTSINISGKKHITASADVIRLVKDPELPERIPSVRFRKTVPTSWIRLTLTEGKNRQVRKMTASVGFPTLRLVRISIENLNIENLLPGEVREISSDKLYQFLFSGKSPV